MRYRQVFAGAVVGLSCFSAGFAGEPVVDGNDDAEASGRGGSWLEFLSDGLHRVDGSVELLHSDDIEIEQYQFQYELKQLDWDFGLTLNYTTFDEEYEPSIIGNSARLSEETRRIEARFGKKLGDKWDVDFTARYYDGFSGYRSVWIAEYYRQLVGLVPGYEDPDSEGYSYSLGATYSYLPGNSVRLSVGYGRDTIAPGYSFGFAGLEQSRPNLYRRSATLRFENVWTKWLKSEHLFSYSDISARDVRLGVKSSWHVALGEKWTLRLNAGYSEEDPQFEAEYGGIAIEWNFAPRWYLGVNWDVYTDTGEIPNAGLVTTAAPGLETNLYGVGLRWVGEDSAFRLYVAMYDNDYDALSPTNQIFSNLYQDRDWVLVQVSYTYEF